MEFLKEQSSHTVVPALRVENGFFITPTMSLIRIEGGCISFFSFLNVSFSRDILPGLAMAAQKGLQALCKTGAVLQCMYVMFFFFSFGH